MDKLLSREVVLTVMCRVSPQQKNFIERMKECGAVAGVCRSPEEAVSLICNY